ncbi:polysaccharide biosynthesis protein [Marinitoga sp. 1154]|uniref:polysaccharide biosynthesis protein n=1 Tax=Marinitoga sp. 1154 TaxID=1643335 RepID=UPI001585EB26|nr:polysaccharide biosynthesis protein [Marinitoga sp. 1154]NUV00469.1 polysaccharide biosynthesis protein [Marinitoga sp. 1154]
MNLKKDLAKVFGANLVQVLVGIVNGFFVPAFLGLDQYAFLKTYTLYIGYIGILHFGFIDGIYVKYGGKNKENINFHLLKYEHNFLLIFQTVITFLFLVVGMVFKDFILIAFSLSIIPINMQTFFSFLYQALGELSLYAKVKVAFPLLILIFNLSIIFIFKVNKYTPFILANLIAIYILFLIFEIQYNRVIGIKNVKIEKDKKEIKRLFVTGIFVMLGNLSSMFVYSLDRWFVKFLLSIKDFAYYSFAISMMGIINMMIFSVTLTFYPYLARGYREEQIKKIKNYMIIIGAIFSFGYFVLGFIVNILLKRYIPSLDVIAILFAGFPAIAVINALYVNLYKVNKQERKYFWTVFLMVIISFILNVIAVVINKNSQSIAFATTIGFYVWFFYSSKDFKGLETNKKEIMFLSLYLPLFFISTLYLDLLKGTIVFGIGVSLLVFVFYRKEFLELTKKILKK